MVRRQEVNFSNFYGSGDERHQQIKSHSPKSNPYLVYRIIYTYSGEANTVASTRQGMGLAKTRTDAARIITAAKVI